MKILYNLFFILFSIFYLPYLFVKGKYHKDFIQKFGILPDNITAFEHQPVWIHAVSVGEAVLGARLSGSIKERFPDIPVVISTTTRTGNDMARKLAGGSGIDAVFYYPVDLSSIVSRVVRIVKPRLYIMMETELWPNILGELSSKGIPVILANGRISDRSFTNYKKIKVITGRILKCIDHFCMQTNADAEKIKELGAPADRISVTGNIKFDIASAGPGKMNKTDIGFNETDRVLVAGSTHFPEEKYMIDLYKELKHKQAGLKLVLAPRHIERADSIKQDIKKLDLKYRCFSDIIGGNPYHGSGYDILIVDTIGHLKDIYNIATVVFIGGSIAKKGGQNPIEAARWGKAVVFGPHMFNFREVAGIFVENGSATCVKNVDSLKEVIDDLLANDEKREQMAASAREVILNNSGAVDKTVAVVEQYLNKET